MGIMNGDESGSSSVRGRHRRRESSYAMNVGGFRGGPSRGPGCVFLEIHVTNGRKMIIRTVGLDWSRDCGRMFSLRCGRSLADHFSVQAR